MNRMENKLPNGMTKTEMLESLKSYTDFPEVIDEAIDAINEIYNRGHQVAIGDEFQKRLEEFKLEDECEVQIPCTIDINTLNDFREKIKMIFDTHNCDRRDEK